jgi:hypothetical protein
MILSGELDGTGCCACQASPWQCLLIRDFKFRIYFATWCLALLSAGGF